MCGDVKIELLVRAKLLHLHASASPVLPVGKWMPTVSL
jgi:hypothetical protein